MFSKVSITVFSAEAVHRGENLSRTDILSEPRLQRPKHGNNSARSSEQQDMQALG